jgi:polysaccharide export outer membrane protein
LYWSRKFIAIFLFCFTATGFGWVNGSLAQIPGGLKTDPQKSAAPPTRILTPSRKPSRLEIKKAQASPQRMKSASSSKRRSRSGFTLGPRDLIQISVWGNDKLIAEMPVRPDGLISFPLIGDFRAAGLTPSELRKQITANLEQFINDPNVSVIVKEINSDTIRISMGGEVNEPGSYEVHTPVTLLHAISAAKGFTKEADLKKSYLLRRGKKVRIDFFALIENSDLSQNVFLHNNDLIYFPGNFENRVNIIGEVKKPQVIRFQEGMTVLDAVLLAEGLTEIAKPTASKIYRKVIQGSGQKSINKIQVELGKVIFDGDLSKNVPLKPGDIILIPRSFF